MRFSAPWLARWISADPMGPVDGPNLFLFVGNNPVMLVDPSGGAGEGAPQLTDAYAPTSLSTIKATMDMMRLKKEADEIELQRVVSARLRAKDPFGDMLSKMGEVTSTYLDEDVVKAAVRKEWLRREELMNRPGVYAADPPAPIEAPPTLGEALDEEFVDPWRQDPVNTLAVELMFSGGYFMLIGLLMYSTPAYGGVRRPRVGPKVGDTKVRPDGTVLTFGKKTPTSRVNRWISNNPVRRSLRRQLGYANLSIHSNWGQDLMHHWFERGLIRESSGGGLEFLDMGLNKWFPIEHLQMGHVMAAVEHNYLMNKFAARLMKQGVHPTRVAQYVASAKYTFMRNFDNYVPQYGPWNEYLGRELGKRVGYRGVRPGKTYIWGETGRVKLPGE
jgi:hypothetical protein